jgi:hypothetical protein
MAFSVAANLPPGAPYTYALQGIFPAPFGKTVKPYKFQ